MQTVNSENHTPVVLVIGGNDPVGGAGLCADIQTLASLGCHAAPVVTAVTRQNTCGVSGFLPIDAGLVGEQIACVLEDMPVAAIKTGMLASSAVVEIISPMLARVPEIPLIVDPVLASNMGNSLSERTLVETLLDQLLPLASILTPNVPELQVIMACTGTEIKTAEQLSSELGADILLTGTHDTATEKVVNRLFRKNHDVMQWQWDRLPGEYHGSGCTMASALAAGLAQNLDIVSAAEQAQEFTWQALKHAFKAGRCQQMPNRISNRPATQR
jgi:hydroxymethylpyrimidine/phosphomethylpyrimidine kinase